MLPSQLDWLAASSDCCSGLQRHRTAGPHVLRFIPRADAGAEEAAVGDKGLLDVGLCGPSEAASGCLDSDSCTAATTPCKLLQQFFILYEL